MKTQKNHGLGILKEATSKEFEDALKELVGGIEELDQDSLLAMKERLDAKIKPLRSLGVLEDIAQQIAGIMRTPHPKIEGKAVLLMAGDHGVVAEGVSAAPQEVTAQLFYSYLSGGGGINVLARHGGAKVISTDIGMVTPLNPPELMASRVKS